MNPFLINAAASVAGNVLQTITSSIAPKGVEPERSASAVPFSTMLDRAAGPSPAAIAERTAVVRQKLASSVEVAQAMNQHGLSGPVTLQISSAGDAALRSANGDLKPLTLSAEQRDSARELFALQQSMQPGTARFPAGPVTVQIGPKTGSV